MSPEVPNPNAQGDQYRPRRIQVDLEALAALHRAQEKRAQEAAQKNPSEDKKHGRRSNGGSSHFDRPRQH